ncbi:hypothetical protein BDP27DRAFT_1403593 [Rhodocollybia butyracea]|uniref:Zn(2)-C6 fungal-type domain-containing protein n=1 Tax=Rhodocollybia butyracea TaxID=206335 RepID=A0A9P5U6J4_9AGAR|nr:hypothetical protein BDP27DRAFT_1403593 [Rhodocollybia butyracea]
MSFQASSRHNLCDDPASNKYYSSLPRVSTSHSPRLSDHNQVQIVYLDELSPSSYGYHHETFQTESYQPYPADYRSVASPHLVPNSLQPWNSYPQTHRVDHTNSTNSTYLQTIPSDYARHRPRFSAAKSAEEQGQSAPPAASPHIFPNSRHASYIHLDLCNTNNARARDAPRTLAGSFAGSLDPSTGVYYRTPEHPRLRTAQACEKCRTRKAKCSGDHPSCKRCLNRGLVCEYAKEGRVRGPNKPKPKFSDSDVPVSIPESFPLPRAQTTALPSGETSRTDSVHVSRRFVSPSILPPSMSLSVSPTVPTPTSHAYDPMISPISVSSDSSSSSVPSSNSSAMGSSYVKTDSASISTTSFSDNRSNRPRPPNLYLSNLSNVSRMPHYSECNPTREAYSNDTVSQSQPQPSPSPHIFSPTPCDSGLTASYSDIENIESTTRTSTGVQNVDSHTDFFGNVTGRPSSECISFAWSVTDHGGSPNSANTPRSLTSDVFESASRGGSLVSPTSPTYGTSQSSSSDVNMLGDSILGERGVSAGPEERRRVESIEMNTYCFQLGELSSPHSLSMQRPRSLPSASTYKHTYHDSHSYMFEDLELVYQGTC